MDNSRMKTLVLAFVTSACVLPEVRDNATPSDSVETSSMTSAVSDGENAPQSAGPEPSADAGAATATTMSTSDMATQPAAGSGAAAMPAMTASTSGSSMTAAAGSAASVGTTNSTTGTAGAAAPARNPGASNSGNGQLPVVTTTDGTGPFNGVVKVKNTPPGGWLIYPMELGKDGVKHPLFIFGPGGGSTPDTYEQMGMHWDRYGSYGFVIYVLPMSDGKGAAMKAGLDWLITQNDDMSSALYQKLDTSKVCAAGHSQGSITVFDFMPDNRVTTTIHISGGSFDGMGPSHLKKPAMYLCGPDGSADVAFPQCETDFEGTTVPIFYANIQGSAHLTTATLGRPATIAWMLWHLADQASWKKDFLEPTGQFQSGIYKSQTKNW